MRCCFSVRQPSCQGWTGLCDDVHRLSASVIHPCIYTTEVILRRSEELLTHFHTPEASSLCAWPADQPVTASTHLRTLRVTRDHCLAGCGDDDRLRRRTGVRRRFLLRGRLLPQLRPRQHHRLVQGAHVDRDYSPCMTSAHNTARVACSIGACLGRARAALPSGLVRLTNSGPCSRLTPLTGLRHRELRWRSRRSSWATSRMNPS